MIAASDGELENEVATEEIFAELYVRDINASIEIFCGGLNFKVDQHTEDFVSLRLGRNRLLLNAQAIEKYDRGNPIHSYPEDQPRGVGVELGIIVSDLDGCYERLLSRADLRITSEPRQREWGSRDFRFVHPDGFYIRVSD